MDDLIKALQILRKYRNPRQPFVFYDYELRFIEINPDDVSTEDKAALETLGVSVSESEDGYFYSMRFCS